MYREKHGCNSMPPLRRPFNHKINTLSQQKQIFREKFFNPFPGGAYRQVRSDSSLINRDFLVSPEFCGSY